MKILLVIPHYDYGIKEWGYSHEYIHIRDSFLQIPDIEIIDFDFTAFGDNYERMNSDLLSTVRERNPHIVWFTFFRGMEFFDSTLEEIKRQSVSINQAFDDQWRFEDFSVKMAPKVSYWLTTKKALVPKFNERGINNVFFSPMGVNTRIFHPTEEDKDIDVSFIGQPHSNRRYIINEMRQHLGPDRIKVFGRGWTGQRGTISDTYISWEETVSIMNRSKICLNLSKNYNSKTTQIKGRHFEIPATCSFQLSEPFEEQELFFNQETLTTFDSLYNGIDKIRILLANPKERERQAKEAYADMLKNHTWVKRINDVLDRL
jgi:hypothetical protein